jgi:5-methylcytosine-specific restriction endonuclease McrA
MVKTTEKAQQERAKKVAKSLKKIKFTLKKLRRPPSEKRKRIERMKNILKKIPEREEDILEMPLTRAVEKDFDEVLEFAKECDNEEWEDVVEIRTKAPKLPSRLSIGNDIVFNGERGKVGWYKDTRANVIKNNIKKYKGKITCENKKCRKTLDLKEVEIDHIIDWSRRQNEADVFIFCYEGWHFSGQLLEDIKEVYNDESNLQVLCDKCNPGKSGKKGDDLNGPQSAHACPHGGGDDCKFPKAR